MSRLLCCLALLAGLPLFAAEQAYLKDYEVCGWGTARRGVSFPGNRGMQEPVDLFCMGANNIIGYNMGASRQMPKNPPLGFSYMLKAAQQGYVPAEAGVGVCYANGTGVQQNFGEAAKWYEKAADAGDPQAANNLSLLYKNGQGVPRDMSKANWWLKFGAERGSAVAEDNLYWRNRGPDPPQPDAADYDQAVKQYLANNFAASLQLAMKAAQAGNRMAQVMVGIHYEDGKGVTRNDAQAATWYAKAANGGFSVGQTDLANMYARGFGVQKNYAEALKWYQKAAEQRNAEAYYGLGRLYEYGYGVPKNRLTAIQYYEKAGARGNQMGVWMARYLSDPMHPDFPPDNDWWAEQARRNAAGMPRAVDGYSRQKTALENAYRNGASELQITMIRNGSY